MIRAPLLSGETLLLFFTREGIRFNVPNGLYLSDAFLYTDNNDTIRIHYNTRMNRTELLSRVESAIRPS